ncbi:hypothetical protein TSOC_010072 [Tetrabaena socialis]|uniref:Uncharacterized protein n=1 Tax=Tetrabaena socialis TaxID=47790 RepID=A0A2J7ZU85_9CHLO|nr:hypothetical protein TSOC_010072 [Tetrabaena socialis]|eukprot:PNH03833.1 hypothetical protein TSOC_010072 [Tetrabaena socialis]
MPGCIMIAPYGNSTRNSSRTLEAEGGGAPVCVDWRDSGCDCDGGVGVDRAENGADWRPEVDARPALAAAAELAAATAGGSAVPSRPPTSSIRSCTLATPPMFMSAPAAYTAAWQSPGLCSAPPPDAGEGDGAPLASVRGEGAEGEQRAATSLSSASSCGTPRHAAMASCGRAGGGGGSGASLRFIVSMKDRSK